MRPEGAESGSARIFFNFLSSPPVIRLAEIFKWLFTSRFGFALTVSVAAAFLALELWLVFFDFNILLNQDEGEHLHVVYALERGEVPYRDFLENHPVLMHLFLLWLKRLFGLTDVSSVYLLSRAFIFLHIIACIALFTGLLCRFCRWEFGAARYGLVFIIVLPLLGIWGGMSASFWEVSPDWIAFFHAYLAATAHLIMLRKITHDQGYSGWLILGAAAFGLGAATLAKVAYVIIPYALTLCLAAVLASETRLKIFFRKWRRLFLINSVFVALSLLFFAGFVALELWASGADLMDYIHANYTLNSIKHNHALNWNRNPVPVLSRILDLPTAAAYVLIVCSVPLFLSLHDREKFFLKCPVIFIGLTVLFNASFPAWSNGALFDPSFIPSAMAAALYVALLIIRLLHYAAPRLHFGVRSGRRLTVHQRSAALQLALAFIILLYMFFASAYATAEITARLLDAMEKRRQMTGDSGTVFAPELYLPSDRNYLTVNPPQKPVAAPVWGYFFFAGANWRFWSDAHRLGFAPDPARHWRALYDKSPPDALAVGSLRELEFKIRVINSKQEIDVSWLLERARRDYTCITRGRAAYMRNDLAQAYLRKGGWRLCDQPD